MPLEDVLISRSIIERYREKLLDHLEVDVAMVGGGPANLIAGYYLGKAGAKAVVFESKLAPGGGMWGGGMMFNEVVIQDEAVHIAEELGIRCREAGRGVYTMDSVEATATIISQCVRAGTLILNMVKATDVLFREEEGKPRVAGLVVNWSPVHHLELPVDPLGVKASFVIDGTGHPAEICRTVRRKLGVELQTRTGDVVGEMPLWADKGEEFTVSNTAEVYPGLFVAGMAANNVFGGPRMGPIFGGMMQSGQKVARLILERLKG